MFSEKEPSSSQTPTIDKTAMQIEPANQSERRALRDQESILPSRSHSGLLIRHKVAVREQYRCALIGAFDSARAQQLREEGRHNEVPRASAFLPMEAAHIIPLKLNMFNDNSPIEVVRYVFLFSRLV